MLAEINSSWITLPTAFGCVCARLKNVLRAGGFICGCELCRGNSKSTSPWQMTFVPDTGTILRACIGLKAFTSTRPGVAPGQPQRRIDISPPLIARQPRRVYKQCGRKGSSNKSCRPQAVSSGWEGKHLSACLAPRFSTVCKTHLGCPAHLLHSYTHYLFHSLLFVPACPYHSLNGGYI